MRIPAALRNYLLTFIYLRTFGCRPRYCLQEQREVLAREGSHLVIGYIVCRDRFAMSSNLLEFIWRSDVSIVLSSHQSLQLTDRPIKLVH